MRYHGAPHNIRDAIESEVVAALGKLGIEWNECGPLDGWVVAEVISIAGKWRVVHPPAARSRRMIPVELKDPSRRNWKASRKFTQQQIDFMGYCDRYSLPYFVWHSVDECIQTMTGK